MSSVTVVEISTFSRFELLSRRSRVLQMQLVTSRSALSSQHFWFFVSRPPLSSLYVASEKRRTQALRKRATLPFALKINLFHCASSSLCLPKKAEVQNENNFQVAPYWIRIIPGVFTLGFFDSGLAFILIVGVPANTNW